MTQVLIDRATLELVLRTLNRLRYDNDSVMAEEGFHEAAEALRAALANAETTGWIAVKDRMPPPQVRVLGFAPRYNIVVVDMWFGPDFNWGYSYWMPLPTPPKDTP